MHSDKDPLGLQVPGAYQIACSCGKVYVGQTGKTASNRAQEHKCHLKLGNTVKSATAQHGWDTGHAILFENTMLLHKFSNWHEGITKELMEISVAKSIH